LHRATAESGLLARWFDKARSKAMGFAYRGIGLGGALVPLLSVWLQQRFGWRVALRRLESPSLRLPSQWPIS
jgi:MFS family permease